MIGGLVSEGYQVIGRKVVGETPAESGWAEVVPSLPGLGRQGQGQEDVNEE